MGVINWSLIVWGGSAVACSIGMLAKGEFHLRNSRNGKLVTSETHPHMFWITVIATFLVGASVILIGIKYRAVKHQKSGLSLVTGGFSHP